MSRGSDRRSSSPTATPDAFLAPLSVDLLPLPAPAQQELRELAFAASGKPRRFRAERSRNGSASRAGARGGCARRSAGAGAGRRLPAEIAERLEFPDAVGNELTLRRALAALVDRALARPERGGGSSGRSRSRRGSSAVARGGGR